ncbi:MAG: precorrin-8X methylmutase [Pseudobutyrivibrio sp.]|nr:precorrin-8X methylmutase [Pseudobutyrivibrio sp.]
MNIEYILPNEIEHRSFEIITAELEAQGITIPLDQAPITKRVIHTSADFDYAKTMCYSNGAIDLAKELIKSGAHIVTDTNMALAGINKKKLASYGGQVHCFMADEAVAIEAKQRQVTRATVSMERAAALNMPVIFAIGNAPTALISLYEMMEAGVFTPEFVIGVPVGFVNVEAAKELFLNSTVPYIINKGRKGGSNIAAAIVNAILYSI